MNQTLKERQRSYEERLNIKLMPKVPVVIKLDARSFSKISRNCEKPFSPAITRCFTDTMISLAKDIDGVVFGYHNSDEINLILRNDMNHNTDPWLGNHLQKIVSVSAAMASNTFNRLSIEDDVKLEEDVVFESGAWTLPNYTEAVNYLINRQNECLQKAITDAAYYEIIRRFDKDKARELLDYRGISDREQALRDLCKIDFFTYYQPASMFGVAAFKAPRIQNGMKRNRWVFDTNLSRFSDSYDFLYEIISTGSDVFRADRDLIE